MDFGAISLGRKARKKPQKEFGGSIFLEVRGLRQLVRLRVFGCFCSAGLMPAVGVVWQNELFVSRLLYQLF